MHYICGLLAARPTNMTKGQNGGGEIEAGCPANVHVSSNTAGGGNTVHFPSCVMTSQ